LFAQAAHGTLPGTKAVKLLAVSLMPWGGGDRG